VSLLEKAGKFSPKIKNSDWSQKSKTKPKPVDDSHRMSYEMSNDSFELRLNQSKESPRALYERARKLKPKEKPRTERQSELGVKTEANLMELIRVE
jgi:cyclopropane fatty-acyl-phospholipid synthase-like methyltransferase